MEKYKEIFKKFSVPTFVIDRNYKIVDMSESALHVFETHDVELNVSKCYEVSHASNKPCWEFEYNSCPAKDTFESGRRSRAIHKHKTKPNEIVHDVVSTPICNEQGEVVYVLEEYHSSVQEFRGLITMCSYCKKIRMEDGKWVEVEKYIESHTTAQLSHGYCEDCLEEIEDKI